MTSILTGIVKKKVFGEVKSNNFGYEDALYEQVTKLDRNGNPTGKTARQKRPVPVGIPQEDVKILNKVRRRAHRLDTSINICGLRFGISAIIGLIPGLGDVFDLLMALMVLRTCEKVSGGLDPGYRRRMMQNISLDFFIGLIPFLGDLGDAIFKANSRNAMALYEMLDARSPEPQLAVNIRKKGNKIAKPQVASSQQSRIKAVNEQATTGQQLTYPDSVQVRDLNRGAPPKYDDEMAWTAPEMPTRNGASTQPATNDEKRGWLSSLSSKKPAQESDLERGDGPGPSTSGAVYK